MKQRTCSRVSLYCNDFGSKKMFAIYFQVYVRINTFGLKYVCTRKSCGYI